MGRTGIKNKLIRFVLVVLLALSVLSILPVQSVMATAPTVTSIMVEGVGKDWVILRGYISNDQSETIDTIGFDYGITTAYGSEATDTVSLATGDYFVLKITGLQAGSVYHWRAKASYVGSATGYGADSYFSTTGSPVVYEYLDTGGDGDSEKIYGSGWTAQQFTVGAISHTVTSATLQLKRVGTLSSDVTVSIKHANESHLPTGLDLCSATIDGDLIGTAYGLWELEFTETSLEAGEEYAIVVRATLGDTDNYIMWQKDSGGGLADAVGSHSTNGGVSWTSDTPVDYLFQIWGNPCLSIESAKVFTGYVEDNDLIFLIEYINTYPPYYPNDAAADYFDMQLFDTDGTTLIASNVIKEWGDMPYGLYLSAAQASALTWGSTYYIKQISGDIVGSYQLTANDWRGSDLTIFDSWIIRIAYSMEEYYDTDFVTYNRDGTVLNEAAGYIFNDNIIGLAYIRPDLFDNISVLPQYELPEWTNSFNDGLSWETELGTQVSGIASSWAELFGISSNTMISVMLIFFYLILAIILAVNGNIVWAAVLSLPFLLVGAVLGVINIQLIIGVAAIVALIVVYKIWFASNA